MHTVAYFAESSAFGGAEQALLTLMAGLDRNRWRIVLFHHDEPSIETLLQGAQALDVQLIEVPRLDRRQKLAASRRFLRALRRLRPDIFHAHLTWPLSCSEALVLAAVARVPARIATMHLFVELPRNTLLAIKRRIVTSTVTRYIAVSRDTAQHIEQLGVPSHKIAVIHNSVPCLQPSRQGQSSHVLFKNNGRPVVLTPARLTEQKGHQYLLQAALNVPDALFVLAGDGPERCSLEKQAVSLGLSDRIVFLGHRKDVQELLAQCDLFVLPSLFEGLPLSVLEAMAAGKPVIASNIGGTNEAVVNGETGLLVPPGDPDALADAIRTLLSDPSLARRMAAAAKERVSSEFSVEQMVARTTAIYDALLPVA
jgi:glycosyltransferase involved in cell wall biosynthesis